jgi:hypothetical protein
MIVAAGEVVEERLLVRRQWRQRPPWNRIAQ